MTTWTPFSLRRSQLPVKSIGIRSPTLLLLVLLRGTTTTLTLRRRPLLMWT